MTTVRIPRHPGPRSRCRDEDHRSAGVHRSNIPTGRETQGRLHSGCLSQICWPQPPMRIGWDIRDGITRSPRIHLTQTMVTDEINDTAVEKLLRQGYPATLSHECHHQSSVT